MIKMTAVIMASGLSKRMGENKLIKKIQGKELIKYTIELVDSLPFAEKIIVTPYEEIKKLVPEKMTILDNKNNNKGISESIKIGVKNSNSENPIIFFQGDMPYLTKETLEKIIKKYQEDKEKILIPRYENQNKSPVIFPEKYRKELINLQGDTGGKTIIKKHPSQIRYYEIENIQEFKDIDTKEDIKN